MPTTSVDVQNAVFHYTPDFLPDAVTLSGTDFRRGPHVSFATEWRENKANFNYRGTTYYRLAVKGRLPYPCRGRDGAEERCRDFMYVLERMEHEGYVPDFFHPITLVHSDDDALIVMNGKHRLAALIALGERHAAVQVCLPTEIRAMFATVQDRAWPSWFYRQSTRVLSRIGAPGYPPTPEVTAIFEYIRSHKLETWAEIYHPLPFPEFTGLTTQLSPSGPYQRLAAILKRSGPVAGKRVLDVGANIGFYTFSLSQRHAAVTAVEQRPEYAHIAKEVSRLYSLPVQYRNEPVTPELINAHGPFDIALCFSVLQWLIHARGEAFGRSVMQAISQQAHELYFDVSVNQGKAALTAGPGQEKAFGYRLLREWTDYAHVECIGRTRLYHNVYRYLFHCRHRP